MIQVNLKQGLSNSSDMDHPSFQWLVEHVVDAATKFLPETR